MSEKNKHSVRLDSDKCKGCTTCLKRCPTEAIRIRGGKAFINKDKCIDCGECIRLCPYQAKKATHDDISDLDKFKYKIALPAPSLYGQFNNLDNIGYIIKGLRDIGFDDVFEVACAAELVTAYTRMYITQYNVKKPVISSACPTILRLISANYPFLCENIMPILPPVDIAAIMAREKAKKEHPELKDEDIGIAFISPCPAKVSYVKSKSKPLIDVTLSVKDIYFLLLDKMKVQAEPDEMTESGLIGIGWACTGGESSAVFNEKYLAADGIENCIRVLEQIDNEDIKDLDFVELNACDGGCVGGAMTIENPFITQTRLKSLKRYLPVSANRPTGNIIPDRFFNHKSIEYTPHPLSDDREVARKMMSDIEKISNKLPGIDCGSCGAPTCMSFAEDIVKGETCADECTVLMRAIFHEYLKEHDKKLSGEDIIGGGGKI